MDPFLCLEDDIRKSQVNKEVVAVVFFDVEKAYDMLWRVVGCSVCAQAKVPHQSTQGLLQPLPIPHRPWSHIALDFVMFLQSRSLHSPH